MSDVSDDHESEEGIQLDSAPRGKGKQATSIKATRFAPAYKSIFTQKPETGNIISLAAHVNCNYLSTLGKVPTLLEMKQHAQSLVILIGRISMSEQSGLIDNENSGIAGAFPFSDGSTFDFLNNLSKPYDGPKNPALMKAHILPLTSLINVLSQATLPDYDFDEPHGHAYRNMHSVASQDVCPLHYAVDSAGYPSQSQPYATHQALISHANEVLEMIDHEYSAVGGLLGILPKAENKDQRAKAESTLLGQLILYMTRLVQRIHDLERLYANSLDCLASESVVPHEALSALGPDGRKGREIVYPQDRFVLVNAGENVWQFLNSEFEYREEIDERVAANYKKHGVAGEAIWEQRGGKEMSRGITAIDITTRYYRLRGDPLKTVFVIPAHGEHPGTKATRKMETEPTVVAVVKPVWPERVSEWEKKHRAEIEELKKLRYDVVNAQNGLDEAKNSATVTIGINAQLKKRIAVLDNAMKSDVHAEKAKVMQEAETLQKMRATLEAERASQKGLAAQFAAQKAQISAMQTQLDAERLQFQQEQQERQKQADDMAAARMRKLDAMDMEQATAAQELAGLLKSEWREEVKKVMELKRFVERYQVAINLDSVVPTGTTRERQRTLDELAASDKKMQEAIARDARLKEEARRAAAESAGPGDADMAGT
ncbi:uncharacterized protein RSE6_12691 [Rhynchosporium secalis]|uniref:Uncharacterized protein n=1 Tax=Rhynchosporium secalis TaxID=38038 RepID=A0A1E1MR18_RHYSE|nr:uncharacterized protein RSE6_12691 [Rhynchosporium secalis]